MGEAANWKAQWVGMVRASPGETDNGGMEAGAASGGSARLGRGLQDVPDFFDLLVAHGAGDLACGKDDFDHAGFLGVVQVVEEQAYLGAVGGDGVGVGVCDGPRAEPDGRPYFLNRTYRPSSQKVCVRHTQHELAVGFRSWRR